LSLTAGSSYALIDPVAEAEAKKRAPVSLLKARRAVQLDDDRDKAAVTMRAGTP
jgi:hypothetical protein